MSLVFERKTEVARFRNHLEGMREVEHVIERRRDPLTGKWSVTSNGLKDKGRFFFAPTDYELLNQVATETKTNCFFCPENLESSTPRYSEDLLPGGCLNIGECFLFPNLFPLSGVHAVVVLGKRHVLRLNEFSSLLLRDGFDASVRFARSVYESEKSNIAFTVNANYLFPAGASIVHPHLQVFGGQYLCTTVQEITACCKHYREHNGVDYFEYLVEEERKEGRRYIGAKGPAHWLTPFAPVGTNEVLCILPGYANLLEVDAAALDGLAEGLSRVLAYYNKIGFSTFNFSLYSASVDGAENYFPVFLRVLCRQNLHANYRADDYFIQKLLGEELILNPPEDLAEGIRGCW